MTRVLVCGGRSYGVCSRTDPYPSSHAMATRQREVFLEVMRPYRVRAVLLIHGFAKGADALAIQWANSNGVPELGFRADWEAHSRAAGPIRNQRMIDEGKPDLVIAFPGGRGTADMVRRAKAAGIEVREVKP